MAKKDRFNQNPGPLKRFEPKSKPLPKPKMHIGLTIALAVVATTLALQIAGVIDVTGFLNPDSPKYLDFPSIIHPEESPNLEEKTQTENWWQKFLSLFVKESKSCPKTSSEMTTPCCKRDSKGINHPQTSIVEVSASCKQCPSDTVKLEGFAPHTADFTAKYGQYYLCECKTCPE